MDPGCCASSCSSGRCGPSSRRNLLDRVEILSKSTHPLPLRTPLRKRRLCVWFRHKGTLSAIGLGSTLHGFRTYQQDPAFGGEGYAYALQDAMFFRRQQTDCMTPPLGLNQIQRFLGVRVRWSSFAFWLTALSSYPVSCRAPIGTASTARRRSARVAIGGSTRTCRE